MLTFEKFSGRTIHKKLLRKRVLSWAMESG